eukprot:7011387-Pyramimonas_sp.AAC.1
MPGPTLTIRTLESREEGSPRTEGGGRDGWLRATEFLKPLGRGGKLREERDDSASRRGRGIASTGRSRRDGGIKREVEVVKEVTQLRLRP